MKRRRWRKSALHDHSIALAGVIVAGSAVNVVTFAAALQISARNRERELICQHAIFFSCVEQFIEPQLPARHRPRHWLPLRAPIPEEIRRLVRQVFWLDVHIQPASGDEHRDQTRACNPAPSCDKCGELSSTLQSQTLRAVAIPRETPSFLPDQTSGP